jgi:hypothetical protein
LQSYTTREDFDKALSLLDDLKKEAEYRRNKLPDTEKVKVSYVTMYGTEYSSKVRIPVIPVDIEGDAPWTGFLGLPFYDTEVSEDKLVEVLSQFTDLPVELVKDGDPYGPQQFRVSIKKEDV